MNLISDMRHSNRVGASDTNNRLLGPERHEFNSKFLIIKNCIVPFAPYRKEKEIT